MGCWRVIAVYTAWTGSGGSVGEWVVVAVHCCVGCYNTCPGVERRYVGRIFHVEVHSSAHVEASEAFLDGGHEYVANEYFVLELYLVLLRMDIDVYVLGVYFEIYEIAWLHVRSDKRLVAVHYRAVKKRMAHVSSVYAEKLLVAAFFCR